MRHLRYDKETCDGWKSYPVHLTLGHRVSHCCSQPAVLVQKTEDGLVTANCFKCGNSETISAYEFRSLRFIVSCPECKHVMTPTLIEENFSYLCENCQLYIWLSDLLPHWEELK
jgi:hypothetical protein